MSEYRTPEEDQTQTEDEERVLAVLEEAIDNAASLKVAMLLGEPPEVVERWIDALWNGLRDNLSDDLPMRGGLIREDRLLAIGLLINDQARARANAILRAVEAES